MKKVTINWLMNSMIVNISREVKFYESDGSPESEKFLCCKWDEAYKQMEADLMQRAIYFIHIKRNEVTIYVRPEGWK